MGKFAICWTVGMMLLIGCSDFGGKRPLPTASSPYQSFGANDTSYLRLSPDWDAAEVGYTFMAPTDITIGRDGYIFVTDQGNNEVVVMDKSGRLQTHSGLDGIDQIEHPVGISIDSKLNVFIVNGSNKIYVWNQYINYAKVDSMLTHVILKDTVTNEIRQFSFPEARTVLDDSSYHYVIIDYRFTGDSIVLESLTKVSVFYEDKNREAQFTGISAASFGKNYIYAVDAGVNRIVQIDVVPNGMVLLEDGWVNYIYIGAYNRTIASYGSGAGTVDSPTAITVDDDGNIYFSQIGGNFLVQKLSSKDFNSVFTLNEHPIMNLTDPPQFVHPADVAVDAESFIYVVEKYPYKRIRRNPDFSMDTTDCYVHKFTPDGRIVDLGNKGITTATFNRPQGIAVDDEDIIYVVNTEMKRIERFKLSISEEDLPRQP